MLQARSIPGKETKVNTVPERQHQSEGCLGPPSQPVLSEPGLFSGQGTAALTKGP